MADGRNDGGEPAEVDGTANADEEAKVVETAGVRGGVHPDVAVYQPTAEERVGSEKSVPNAMLNFRKLGGRLAVDDEGVGGKWK